MSPLLTCAADGLHSDAGESSGEPVSELFSSTKLSTIVRFRSRTGSAEPYYIELRGIHEEQPEEPTFRAVLQSLCNPALSHEAMSIFERLQAVADGYITKLTATRRKLQSRSGIAEAEQRQRANTGGNVDTGNVKN